MEITNDQFFTIYLASVNGTQQNEISVEQDVQVSDWVNVLAIVVGIAVSFLGIVANGATVAAYRRSKKLQTSFNHLITNLCILDLFFGILILPLIVLLMTSLRQTHWYAACQATVYIYQSFSSSIVVNLVFIAINRYVGIVHSSKYSSMFGRHEMKWWIITTWLAAPILFAPFLSVRDANEPACLVMSLSSSSLTMKVYKVILCNLLQIFPVIILVFLYRAIFAKVKECRKTVEHYPIPGSCSPSYVDPEVEGSKISRGRLRSFRRPSSLMKRRNDSTATHKLSGSPLAVNNKFNTMAYLQVPTAKGSIPAEDPRERVDLHNGSSDQSLNVKNYNRDLSELTSSTHSLEVAPLSGIDIIQLAQSSPEISIHTESNMNNCKIEIWKGDLAVNQMTTPLLTSERPRRRMQQDMKSLQIMSTIDSEPYSRSVSGENHDAQDGKGNMVTSPNNDLSNHEYDLTEVCEPRLTSNFTYTTTKQESCSEESEGTKSTIDYNFVQNFQDFEDNRDFTIKKTSRKNVCKFDKRGVVRADKCSEIQQNYSRCLHGLHSMSCADLLNSQPQVIKQPPAFPENFRRHSISTCSEGNHTIEISKKEKPKFRKSLKIRSWRKKYAQSSREARHLSVSSKIEGFANRRIKSEGQRFSKSWKSHWRKKTNPPTIKIVIEHATSEDTVLDHSETVRCYSDIHAQLKSREKNGLEKVLESETRDNCFDKKVERLFQSETNTDHNKLSTPQTTRSYRNKSKSAESLPSRLISSSNNFTNEDLDNNITINSKNKSSDLDVNEQADAEVEQRHEIPDMRRHSLLSESRRSSITSNVYKYTSADDALSRNGSFSCMSFADDCRRRSNNSSMISRQSSKSKRTEGRSRKISFYAQWQRRKSFIFSFNSSASTDTARNKRRREAEKHIAYSGLIICVAFALCVLPSYVVNMISVVTRIHVTDDIKLLAAMMSWLNVVFNPVLYGYLNPQYKVVFNQMWLGQKKQCVLCCKKSCSNSAASQNNARIAARGSHHGCSRS